MLFSFLFAGGEFEKVTHRVMEGYCASEPDSSSHCAHDITRLELLSTTHGFSTVLTWTSYEGEFSVSCGTVDKKSGVLRPLSLGRWRVVSL